METNQSNPRQYVKLLLELYLHTPGTLGRVRREDRRLAMELQERGVPLSTLDGALLLATARRCLRAPDAPPLGPVRSLHYYLPVIEELLANPLPDGYLEYLKGKLKQIQATHETTLQKDRGTHEKPA